MRARRRNAIENPFFVFRLFFFIISYFQLQMNEKLLIIQCHTKFRQYFMTVLIVLQLCVVCDEFFLLSYSKMQPEDGCKRAWKPWASVRTTSSMLKTIKINFCNCSAYFALCVHFLTHYLLKEIIFVNLNKKFITGNKIIEIKENLQVLALCGGLCPWHF